MKPLIVTACTDDYREQARELAASANANGLEILIIPFPDQGNWTDNCRQKPILLDEILEFRLAEGNTQPLLWIDADGMLLRRPPGDLLDALADEADFAACPSRAGLGRRYCAGTLWVNATARAARFMARWADLCRNGRGSDEAQLHLAVETMQAEIRAQDLPHTWGWLPPDGPPTAQTVILHRLSSKPRKRDSQRQPARK